MTIEEAKQALKEYDLTEAIKSDEPHDIIHEIADNNCDIYTSALLDWVAKGDNYQFVEDAIAEFEFPLNEDGKPNFLKAIAQGQYQQNEEALWIAWQELKEEVQPVLATL